MRILQIGKWYPPQLGGMETVLRELAGGLAERGHQAHVLVAAAERRGRIDREGGLEIRRIATWGSLRSMPICPGLLAAIRGELRAFDPQLVQLHLPNPGAGWAWLASGDRRPLLLSYHSDIVRQRWLRGLWRPFEQRLLQRAGAIVTSSEALADSSEVLRPFRDKVQVIPFGIDPHWARPAQAAPPETRGPYFLFVGRLVYYKALGTLLDALEGNDMRVLVVGDGPMRRPWQAHAQRQGVAERVEFLGRRDEEELKRLMVAAVALVLPSSEASETFGLVQLEAMASARPVIAARASAGVESVARDGETGILVPPRDAAALRDAMLSLWNDAARADRMGRAGAQRVSAHFHRDTMLDRFEALYASLLVSGRSTTP